MTPKSEAKSAKPAAKRKTANQQAKSFQPDPNREQHKRDAMTLRMSLATYEAIGNNDLPMMQALFMFSSIAVIVFNIFADVVLTFLDPRIRVGA